MPTDERSPRHAAPNDFRDRAANAIRDRIEHRVPTGPHAAWAKAGVTVVSLALVIGCWWFLRPAGHPAIETVLPRAAATGAAVAGETAAPGTSGSSRASGAPATSVAASLVVHVVGAVNAPGVVRVATGARVLDAVAAAGGLASQADTARVNLAARLIDGQRVVVPAVGQNVPSAVGDSSGGAAGSGPPDVSSPISLNEATLAQLDSLPGVGPATAAAIIAYRDQHGPFRNVDALADVRGIGPAKLDQLRPLVTV